MHNSSGYKARPRTLESRRNQVSVTHTTATTPKSEYTDAFESTPKRLWELSSNLPRNSDGKSWNAPMKTASMANDIFSKETPYRAATIEFFAKPLSSVAWIPPMEEIRSHNLKNNNDSLLAIGSCLGDRGDWIRLVRLQVSEVARNFNESVNELSLNTVTTSLVSDVISVICPSSLPSSSSNSVLLFYGTMRGQVCGVELLLDASGRDSQVLCSKQASNYHQQETVVGLTELPFWNHLVAATNLGNLQMYQFHSDVHPLSHIELAESTSREMAEPVSFTDICTVSETMVAASGRTGSVCCFDTRSFTKESQRLSVAASGISCTCVSVDSGQPNYIFAGTSHGELVAWDRRIVREGMEAPLYRIAAHHGKVSRIGVSPVWNPGVIFTSGKKDAKVLCWDFASAAKIDVSFGRKYKDANSCWEANIQKEQVRNIARDSVFSLNDIDLHPTTPLVAYVSSSSSLNVICL
ncbi:hypothetical protein GpartN1_g33.t1 [Galdieria partita]|uniref:Uncharacterized protein n=1 Tax=Galdieria partita TaxID=83374 RepID=A0A9C7UM62_9RHOD|nr:hypothetical protein GpartN1_g33.t1 [Galdieria partita]